ncbi:hypothetical protein PAHAL_1G438600 [Panicum hallii]|uniref:Uncharacterized protein n=1 Tax=Panicum hallii TaxID=206008 RepID=A0A2S3GUB5_9POAL|nr:hypothetical protein PAHAL_1G438600 [Panicum hallii]
MVRSSRLTDLFLLPPSTESDSYVRTQALTPESTRCPRLTCIAVRIPFWIPIPPLCHRLVLPGLARSSVRARASHHRLARIIKINYGYHQARRSSLLIPFS